MATSRTQRRAELAESNHLPRTKQDALRIIASVSAALLDAGGWDDLFGYDITGDMTDAEVKRLEWATEEVQRRLYNMGGRN